MSSPSTESIQPLRPGVVDRALPLFIALILFIWIGREIYLRMAYQPVEISTMQVRPLQARSHDGVWYWVESEKGQSRLLRDMKVIAKAEVISSYAVDNGTIVWAAKEGSQWMMRKAAQGGADTTIWTGDREPQGLSISRGNLFWTTASSEGLTNNIPQNMPFPALSPRLKVYRQPLGNTTGQTEPSVLATLYESAGDVVGADAENVYIRAIRQGAPGSTALYALPLTGSALPRRLAGEAGVNPALLSPEGTLYWVGPSRDSSEVSAACLRRWTKSGEAETVMDWLPAGGDLSNTPRGVCYVNAIGTGSIWPVVRPGDLPKSLLLPIGYTVLAADEGSVLLRKSGLTAPGIALYRMPLP